MVDAMITAAQAATECDPAECDECMGRAVAAALHVMADEIESGPTFPIPPSVISALVRERADGLAGGA